MTDAQRQLWERIEPFSIDDGPATHGLAARLARENGWTRRFAERAIEEYRRFLLLLAAADHPVSPSPAIDQVWHVHLLYTRSYWDELCRQVVGRPLHHVPSAGGAAEAAKFDQWYVDTLSSYRLVFGSEPPADIWPVPGAGTPHPHLRWVDTRSEWVIRKPSLWIGAAVVVLMLVMLMFAAGCEQAVMAQPTNPTPANPLNWRGREFLWLYAFIAATGLGLAIVVRWAAMAATGVEPPPMRQLGLYEQAYLSGGPTGVVQTAVVALAQRGYISVGRAGRIQHRDGVLPTHLDHVERAIYDAITDGGVRMSDLRRETSWTISGIADQLIDDGLIVSPPRIIGSRVLVILLAWSPVVLGVLKIGVGIARQRPVLYLVILTLLTAWLAYIVCARRILRTSRGSQHLQTLRDQRTQSSANSPAPDGLAAGVALFGVTALAGTEYDHMRRQLNESSWVNSSSNTGACGGASCGSSCGGGGGCGGGGCGGCGGS